MVPHKFSEESTSHELRSDGHHRIYRCINCMCLKIIREIDVKDEQSGQWKREKYETIVPDPKNDIVH